jgi:hypothetical protein
VLQLTFSFEPVVQIRAMTAAAILVDFVRPLCDRVWIVEIAS